MNDENGYYYNYSNTYNPYYTYPQWNNYLGNNNPVYGFSSCYCKKSFFRVLNTYKDKLDIQVNDIIMAENLKKGEFTRYVKFDPGMYQVMIFQSDEPKKLIFESTINIEKNLSYTGVVSEDDEDKTDISILMIPEAKENANTGRMAYIRLINLVSDAPDLELTASDGTILFSGIDYGSVSENIAVPFGRYTLILREKSNKNTVKTMSVDFAPRMHYTLFAVGKYDKNKDIKIIMPEDGVNYLELC